MTTNFAISDAFKREAKDWKRINGPTVLVVKSDLRASAVAVRMGWTPEWDPADQRAPMEKGGRLTSVGDDDIDLSILLLYESSTSCVVILVGGADLNQSDSVPFLRSESSKSVIRIEIDVSHTRKDDVVRVRSELLNQSKADTTSGTGHCLSANLWCMSMTWLTQIYVLGRHGEIGDMSEIIRVRDIVKASDIFLISPTASTASLI
jgi:hypothetical protein